MFPSLTPEELIKLSTLLQLVANASKKMDHPSWVNILSPQIDKDSMKKKWLETEEAALQAGVAKYGLGKWKEIKRDPLFGPVLESRTNGHLKVCFSS